MARTWPASRWKSALVNTIDFFGRPVTAIVRAINGPPVERPVRRILVIEVWQIGDVVLVTPLLSSLRRCFPDASVTLLAKPHAKKLLENSGLVDEVMVAELPWTRPARKYAPSDYSSRALATLVRSMRSRRFDVCFDARMDLRSNVLSWLSGARRRIGFRYGGGDWLLTDAVPVDPLANHKVDDWLSLLAPMRCAPSSPTRCLLRTTENERLRARENLRGGAAPPRRLVGLHPGGSHPGKRWPIARFVELAKGLRDRGYAIAAFVDDKGFGSELATVDGVMALQLSLREMMAGIEQCDVLVCNDSGPMHIAAALGVPTVAIFERGEPRWFGPVGEGHLVISGERAGVDVSAAPLAEDPPNPVPVATVLDAVQNQLSRSPASTG